MILIRAQAFNVLRVLSVLMENVLRLVIEINVKNAKKANAFHHAMIVQNAKIENVLVLVTKNNVKNVKMANVHQNALIVKIVEELLMLMEMLLKENVLIDVTDVKLAKIMAVYQDV